MRGVYKMFTKYLRSVVDGNFLTQAEAYHAAEMLLHDTIPDIQKAAFLSVIRARKETYEELEGFVQAILDKAIHFESDIELLDTCGTGGDMLSTFNISTATALVVAACKVPVAKHGNRAVTGKVGSADVLEAMGVNITMSPDQARAMLDKVGITFLFAPHYHPILKQVASLRKHIGITTIFNFLGPIVNPLNPCYQVMGISEPSLQSPIATTLVNIGRKRAMVVNAENGMDEISPLGKTTVIEVDKQRTKTYTIDSTSLGLGNYSLDMIKGGSLATNIKIILQVLEGEKGAPKDVVTLNSAAALLVVGRVSSLSEGIKIAEEAIDNGDAREILSKMISFSKDGVIGC